MLMEETEIYYGRLMRLGREVYALSPRIRTKEPLSRTERSILAVLCMAKAEGTRVISAQIAERLDVTRSAVSQAVDKLSALGYVQRTPAETDRKIAYIELTPDAEKAYHSHIERRQALFDRVLSRMGEENMSQFLALAEQFVCAAKEVQRETSREEM